MPKTPGFYFYPGDYLRDTQNFCEKVQVAYDRIMCEHMRNICISKSQLIFFTKKLSAEEISELMISLKKIQGGFQIEWVAESIKKSKAYSESRKNNRTQKENKICESYDEHMDYDNGKEKIILNNKGAPKKVFEPPDISEVVDFFIVNGYPPDLAERAHQFYAVADWKDSKGKKVRNWKQKMLSVWFKKEEKNVNRNSEEDKVGRIPISKAEQFINDKSGDPIGFGG